jgi:hypothetical protein
MKCKMMNFIAIDPSTLLFGMLCKGTKSASEILRTSSPAGSRALAGFSGQEPSSTLPLTPGNVLERTTHRLLFRLAGLAGIFWKLHEVSLSLQGTQPLVFVAKDKI